MSIPETAEEGDRQRLAEAAVWRVRLADGEDGAAAAFAAWLASDPANVDAWARVDAPWRFIGEQAAAPELLALRQAALGDARKAVHLRTSWRGALSRFGGASAWAASLLLVCGIALYFAAADRPAVYQTAAGERRSVMLEDGSQLVMDARSEVRVAYSGAARELQLIRGQARFDVARDPLRPFTVAAGGQRVRAIGTAFNIDLLDSTLAVTLLKGQVVVQPEADRAREGIALVPGQQLVFAGEAAPVMRTVNLKLATAWETGSLVFENDTLNTVVARFNRYSDRTLRLVGEDVAIQRISGVFDARDLEGFVATVTAYLPVSASPGPDGSIELRLR